MNKFIIYFFFLAMILTIEIHAQDVFTKDVAYDELKSKPVPCNNKDQIITIYDYDIDLQSVEQAKILQNADMRITPYSNTKKTIAVIPKGSIVDIYRYLPKEAAWIVNYDGKWGFVASTMLAPLQSKPKDSENSPDCEPPQLLSTLHPKYPAAAKNNKIQGQVVIKVLVTKTGEAKDMEIVKSIPALDEAALNALQKMKFKPGKYKGKLTDIWIMIPVNFNL